MRNASRGQILPPLPFDPLAGLEVIEPRNKMETDQAWREFLDAQRLTDEDHDGT